MNNDATLDESKQYVSRSRAMSIIGRKLYSDDRPISLRMLRTLVGKGVLEELTVPTGGVKGKLPRYFISVNSIDLFLSNVQTTALANAS